MNLRLKGLNTYGMLVPVRTSVDLHLCNVYMTKII